MRSSFLLLLIAAFAGTSLAGESVLSIWPQPSSVPTTGDETLILATTFNFTASPNAPADPVLTSAMARYTKLIMSHVPLPQTPPPRQIRRGLHTRIGFSSPASRSANALASCMISVEDYTVPLDFGIDESYSVSVAAGACSINAKTVWGALRGLETFSQLVSYNFGGAYYQVENTPIVIEDQPRFAHRGMLVDSSRHFLPLDTLYNVIDSLSYAKFNTLHWHIVDSQAFPFESVTYPNLWNGTYPNERYTQGDVVAVVEYAKMRGIRVMVEFDGPGHAASWGTGYPQLLPSGMKTLPLCNGTNINNLPLDPANPFTYEVLQGLINEISGTASAAGKPLFPDSFLHLGGDEVVQTCWSASKSIAAFMAEHNFTTYDELEFYYVNQTHTMANAAGRLVVNWEEIFNKYTTQLPKETIIEVWLDHPTLAKVVAAGYRGILANQDSWYLNKVNTTWQQVYLNEPYANITDPAQQALVIGGETCVWGENVDASDIESTMWPRGAAAAERLWSPQGVNDPTSALPRLAAFRCLLNARGIAAAPVNGVGRSAPPAPGSCLSQ